MQAIRADFKSMLRERGEITASSRWSRVLYLSLDSVCCSLMILILHKCHNFSHVCVHTTFILFPPVFILFSLRLLLT
ncbi:hypothetical protein Taro_023124 [Colocasia esculenta]|uniref:FF domain-containing protein n=1 Tax=Colocasia esculenta TaxID=4460 RepID=A0A843V5J9_COLES|nr:hypothetical protein [Colocasia esculenta]